MMSILFRAEESARVSAQVKRINQRGYNFLPIIERILDSSPHVLAESLLKVYFELVECIIASGVNDLPPDFERDLYRLRCIYSALCNMEDNGQTLLISVNSEVPKK